MSLLFLSARLSRKLSGRFFPLGATRFPRSGFSGRFRLLLLHVCLGALARRWPACDRPRGWHPDRETDPKERDRKTKLMQRVNEAYNKNNLLQLLELQLELEHIDQHSINSLSEDRLKHYNKILKEQVRELDQEIEHVETAFSHNYGVDPFAVLSPSTVLRNLAKDIAYLQGVIRDRQRALLANRRCPEAEALAKSPQARPGRTCLRSLLNSASPPIGFLSPSARIRPTLHSANC